MRTKTASTTPLEGMRQRQAAGSEGSPRRVVHFLYDFAYLVVDFKQGVRANRSTRTLMYCGGNSFLLVALVLQTRLIMFQCQLCEFSGRML